jgi:hypothetical protein
MWKADNFQDAFLYLLTIYRCAQKHKRGYKDFMTFMYI